jgi:Ca2+-transporting ATPase
MFTIVLCGLTSRMSRIIVTATIGITLLLVQIPVIASLLHLLPLHLDDLLLAIASAVGIAAVALLGRFGRQN